MYTMKVETEACEKIIITVYENTVKETCNGAKYGGHKTNRTHDHLVWRASALPADPF